MAPGAARPATRERKAAQPNAATATSDNVSMDSHLDNNETEPMAPAPQFVHDDEDPETFAADIRELPKAAKGVAGSWGTTNLIDAIQLMIIGALPPNPQTVRAHRITHTH